MEKQVEEHKIQVKQLTVKNSQIKSQTILPTKPKSTLQKVNVNFTPMLTQYLVEMHGYDLQSYQLLVACNQTEEIWSN